jgi:uncharacterized hydrophobic protein (TIGR00271 family)
MLRLRMSVTAGQVEELVATLSDTHGVAEIVRLPVEGRPERFLLMVDVTPAGADRVTTLIGALERGVEDLVLVHENVVAMPQLHPSVMRREGGFGWAEILGEARINSRPIARYLVMISAAAVIAGLGVITNNGILIVGAMAVSPDLLPICATCVGLVKRRLRLAGSALLTLQLGLALVALISAGLTAALHLTGLIGDIAIGQNGLAGLARTDYSTVLVALAAGVAAMISFETRASAAVGVAISVTTIPASAYLGVAFGLGEPAKAWGALLVLVVNVARRHSERISAAWGLTLRSHGQVA